MEDKNNYGFYAAFTIEQCEIMKIVREYCCAKKKQGLYRCLRGEDEEGTFLRRQRRHSFCKLE